MLRIQNTAFISNPQKNLDVSSIYVMSFKLQPRLKNKNVVKKLGFCCITASQKRIKFRRTSVWKIILGALGISNMCIICRHIHPRISNNPTLPAKLRFYFLWSSQSRITL